MFSNHPSIRPNTLQWCPHSCQRGPGYRDTCQSLSLSFSHTQTSQKIQLNLFCVGKTLKVIKVSVSSCIRLIKSLLGTIQCNVLPIHQGSTSVCTLYIENVWQAAWVNFWNWLLKHSPKFDLVIPLMLCFIYRGAKMFGPQLKVQANFIPNITSASGQQKPKSFNCWQNKKYCFHRDVTLTATVSPETSQKSSPRRIHSSQTAASISENHRALGGPALCITVCMSVPIELNWLPSNFLQARCLTLTPRKLCRHFMTLHVCKSKFGPAAPCSALSQILSANDYQLYRTRGGRGESPPIERIMSWIRRFRDEVEGEGNGWYSMKTRGAHHKAE